MLAVIPQRDMIIRPLMAEKFHWLPHLFVSTEAPAGPNISPLVVTSQCNIPYVGYPAGGSMIGS